MNEPKTHHSQNIREPLRTIWRLLYMFWWPLYTFRWTDYLSHTSRGQSQLINETSEGENVHFSYQGTNKTQALIWASECNRRYLHRPTEHTQERKSFEGFGDYQHDNELCTKWTNITYVLTSTTCTYTDLIRLF